MTRSPVRGPKGLRRSLHFVPGGNERMLEKALGSPADSLILDLEDSVTPANKEMVRDQVCNWVKATDFKNQECLVRINPLDTPWGLEDLHAIAECFPDGLVLPKVASEEEVSSIDSIVSRVETNNEIDEGTISFVLIGTEVPEAVFNLHKMTKIARVDGVTWGAEDLSGVLKAKAKRDSNGNYLEVFSYVRSTCLLAAIAGNAQPIDAVYVDIKNSDGLTKECIDGANMGYTGKVTIHPSQIEIVNKAFTPTIEEVREAEELVAAFEENEKEGRMAFSFKGQMVDVPHLVRAREVVLKAKQINLNRDE